MSEIDTTNDQLVGSNAGAVAVIAPIRRMTPTEARRHAVWLTLVADGLDPDADPSFEEIREAVLAS